MSTLLLNNLSISEIKNKLSIVDTINHYGIKVKKYGSQYFAENNPTREEQTSSLVFYSSTNSFYDFGSNIGGDVIKLIQELEKCNFINALKKAFSILNGGIVSSISRGENTVVNISKDNSVTIALLEKQFNNFTKLTFNHSKHKKDLLEVAPLWLYQESDIADLELFKSICRFDQLNNTLVCGCYNNTSGINFNFMGYKRRRYKNGKWSNAKGTKINNTAFVRVFTESLPIYVIEGYHDLLVAILLGLDFIAIPTAHFNHIEYFDQYELNNREFIFICEDKTGYDGMLKIAQYLAVISKNIRLIQLSNDKVLKLDLSDFVIRFTSRKEVLNALYNR